jgi:phosphoglycolate phosphatase-like HAD superfamily hydrolase
MFQAALEAAQRDGLHLLLVGVSGGRETPPEILELADVVVDSPGEALEVLETLARALGV